MNQDGGAAVRREATDSAAGNLDTPTSDQRALAILRRMIVDGSIVPGEKVTEVGIAALLDMSRTPVRLALKTLEVEGFIRKRDGRGYTVVQIELEDVSKAYEVRGVLEGLAAKLLAHKGLGEDVERKLSRSIATSERIIASDIPYEDRIEAYQKANTLFHETIMHSCGNDYLPFTLAKLESLPMLKIGSVAFNRKNVERELLRLTVGHTQHMIVFDALKSGDGQRAEAMMREHANATLGYAELFAL
ncbi:GntR family transcriptional regulator [Hoeflea sp. WL0058]|uniref:GntR family transcriptional regulator n=1 Tax=Flavimaribacter sediminis TaxID=2865987 RepID=A0AAE3D2S8_9HYPH|nr:GntR family transcriptional regulator [Flavimaribacter sediminis]MBW8640104.1 GntR family transcriptional regulator [Flavimaribacter sediminis]